MARKGMVTQSLLSWKILWVAEINKYWLIDCIFWRNQVGADWDAVQPLLFKEYNRELEDLWWWWFWSKFCCCWLWGWLGSCQRGHQVIWLSTGAVSLLLLKANHILLSFLSEENGVTLQSLWTRLEDIHSPNLIIIFPGGSEPPEKTAQVARCGNRHSWSLPCI